MITKKQLQERVHLAHAQIDRLFSSSDDELKETIQRQWSGIKIANGTRDDMLKIILRGIISELFHPGL